MLQAKIVNDPEVRDGKWGKYILIKTKVLKTGQEQSSLKAKKLI